VLPAVFGEIAHRLIDGFAREGRADLVARFTRTFPLRVIAHIIIEPRDDLMSKLVHAEVDGHS
jgi:hypothetical protein